MGKFPAYTGRNREPGEAGGRSVIFGRGPSSLLPAPGQVLGHRAVPGMGTPDATRSRVLPVLGRPPQDVTTDVRALLQPPLRGRGKGRELGPASQRRLGLGQFPRRKARLHLPIRDLWTRTGCRAQALRGGIPGLTRHTSKRKSVSVQWVLELSGKYLSPDHVRGLVPGPGAGAGKAVLQDDSARTAGADPGNLSEHHLPNEDCDAMPSDTRVF